MTTHIKRNRFDDFKAHAFEYGFHKFANEWCNAHGKVAVFVTEKGDVFAVNGKYIINDVPYEYISKLVWDGFIKKEN